MYQDFASPSSRSAAAPAHEAVCRPIAEARGLPNAAYTSHEHWLAERDGLFARTWTCIGFASDLPRGAYAEPVELMGMPLLVLQGADGGIRVFHNVCSHRGQRLVAGGGPVRGVLRCPYHSWTYDLTGRLRGTPHIGGTGIHRIEGFDCGAHGLKAIRSALWMDMIFVNLSGDAPPFEEHIAPLAERWQQFWGDAGDRYRRLGQGDGLDLEIAANWKLAVENYCESYHLPWVHPGLNTYSKLEDHYNILIAGRFSGQGTRVYRLPDSADRLPQLDTWPEDRLRTAEYIAMYPNVLLGLHVDHFFAMRIDPLAPDRSREYLRLYYLDDGRPDASHDAARQALMDSWRAVFNEDIAVVEGMQAGRQSPGFDGGLFSPVMDKANHHFHRWVAEAVSG
ncbi:MAG TPA: aromatic ring-hydroxylating dioxygenase subunit alpha [Arenicellales bacterium]|nr:aromatic ring-hydroxylating dioxygenase subunit alpha [Arenicellales bacterium]